jgi:hypothetical protein
MKKIIFLLLTLLVSFSFATPQFFTYQGVARNAQGQPLQNTNISLRLQILETSVSGNVVYEETQSATTNDLGLFVLKVGMGAATQGNFSQIDWGSDDHFLQVEMDPTGGSNYQMMGTSQLASVPYALYAESSGGDTTLWQKNPAGINYNGGQVGVGTSSPEYSIDIQENIAAIRMQSNSSVHGSGLILIPGNSANQWWITSQPGIAANPNPGGLNFLKRYPDAFGNIISEHIMDITDAGNVGIGTRTPKTKLQVSDGDIYIEDINAGVIMKSPNGSCWRMTINNSGQPVVTSIICP